MKKNIGMLLILVSLFLGYMGINKFNNSGESVNIVGIEISAEDNQAKTTSYLYLGLAVLSFVGGVVLVKDKGS